MVRSMLLEAWLQRAARRTARASGDHRRRRLVELSRALLRRPRRRARAGAQGVGRGERVAIALPPGLDVRPGAARLPAARGGRRAGRPASLAPPNASVAAGRARAPRAPLAGRGRGGRPPRRAAGAAGARGRARPRRVGRRDPHLRHAPPRRGPSSSPTATSCGARSARPSRSASPRASAGCARCRSSHVGGLSILVRSAIYATTAVVHERFEPDRALARASRARGSRS